MKTIKRVLVLLIMILVVVIYLTNKDTKIYYVSLGDGLGRGMNANDKIGYGYSDYIKEYLEDIDKLEFYTKQFSDKDKRTTDIINNINDNIEIIEDSKPLTIKKALMHADIITLSTGLNELLYKLQNENLDSYQMYKYIDNLIEDIDDLIDIIKKYCKEDIFILGYYNPYVNKNVSDDIDKYIKYANNKLIELSKDEEIIYIDLYNILKNNSQVFTSVDSNYPNIDGYKLISREIIEKIEKKVIKTLKEM